MKKHYVKYLVYILLLTVSLTNHAQIIRVASYNLSNYNLCDRMVNGVYRKNYPKPESEKTALREQLLNIAPDILAVQEIGSNAFLKELEHDLALDGLEYPYSSILDGPDPSRKLAILSKIPFEKLQYHTELPFEYYNTKRHVKRGLLEARFGEDDHAWTLYVLHLKSPIAENPHDLENKKFRLNEALSIRSLILETQHPNYTKYMLLGDFNEGPNESAVKILTQDKKQKFLTRLPAYDSHEEEWTFFYKKNLIYRTLDFILISPNFTENIQEGHAFIDDTIPPLTASDHRLIYVDIHFKDNLKKNF